MAGLPGRTEIAPDPDALASRAAEWFADTLNAVPGNLRIALSGGSTPKGLYALLGGATYRSRIPWQRLELFWGDERFVSRESADSNYRMVKDSLLAHAPIPADRIHPIPVFGAPDEAARQYEQTLKRCYGAEVLDPQLPLFDVILLGLGSDGHTCSLLPNQPVLEERSRWVAPVMSGRSEPRITLTYPAIETSRFLVFLVEGAEKAHAVAAVCRGDKALPAARIQTVGEVIWFLDQAAAHGMN